MNYPLKGRGLTRKTRGRRAREAARRPPRLLLARPSQRRWQLSPAWLETCPPSTGPPDPWALASHAPGISAKEKEPSLVAGLHPRGCRASLPVCWAPFLGDPRICPLSSLTSIHDFMPESLTVPHPLTPLSICSCLASPFFYGF